MLDTRDQCQTVWEVAKLRQRIVPPLARAKHHEVGRFKPLSNMLASKKLDTGFGSLRCCRNGRADELAQLNAEPPNIGIKRPAR
jgi:hypothetical protein